MASLSTLSDVEEITMTKNSLLQVIIPTRGFKFRTACNHTNSVVSIERVVVSRYSIVSSNETCPWPVQEATRSQTLYLDVVDLLVSHRLTFENDDRRDLIMAVEKISITPPLSEGGTQNRRYRTL